MWNIFVAAALLAPAAGAVEFFEGSWEEALSRGKKAEKPIFADFYTDW